MLDQLQNGFRNLLPRAVEGLPEKASDRAHDVIANHPLANNDDIVDLSDLAQKMIGALNGSESMKDAAAKLVEALDIDEFVEALDAHADIFKVSMSASIEQIRTADGSYAEVFKFQIEVLARSTTDLAQKAGSEEDIASIQDVFKDLIENANKAILEMLEELNLPDEQVNLIKEATDGFTDQAFEMLDNLNLS